MIWYLMSIPIISTAALLACYKSKTFREYSISKIHKGIEIYETMGKTKIHENENKIHLKTTHGDITVPTIECSKDYDIVILHYDHEKEGFDVPIDINFKDSKVLTRIKNKVLVPFRRPKDYNGNDTIHGVIVNAFHDKWLYFVIKDNNLVDIEKLLKDYENHVEGDDNYEILAD